MPNRLDLALLLARADDGAAVVSRPFAQEDARRMDNPNDATKSQKMSNTAADPNNLLEQRYAVLAPEGERGERLLDLVRPLLESRCAEQGGKPIVIERLPGNTDLAQARQFRDRQLKKNPPRYWLVLGDLHEMSFESTSVLASMAFVGRLGFSRDEDYESYVSKVLRWENQPSPSTSGQTVLCSVRDGSEATGLAYRALMRPLEDACAREREQEQFRTGRLEHIEATSLSKIEAVFRSNEPTVLFSSSHGLGPPRGGYESFEQQRRLSGAMCIGKDRITADEVKNGAFLNGGIWFYLACYGAGTPARSAFTTWLKALAEQGALGRDAAEEALSGLPMEGTAPFVAAMPKAALANEDGPLAMIGHIDMAWSASFADAQSGENRQTMRFFGALRALVEGRRVGIAHGELSRFFLDTSVALSDMYEEEKQGAAALDERERELRKAQLWMRRHDLGHYVLLGDPAVRLPLASNRVVRVKPDGIADIGVMEKAALAVLGRGETPEFVAKQMGLSAEDVKSWAKEYAAAGQERLHSVRRK